MTFEEYLQKQHLKNCAGSEVLAHKTFKQWLYYLEAQDWITHAETWCTVKSTSKGNK